MFVLAVAASDLARDTILPLMYTVVFFPIQLNRLPIVMHDLLCQLICTGFTGYVMMSKSINNKINHLCPLATYQFNFLIN